MSAMADRIAAEHALRWHQPSLLAACSNPDCKMPVVVLRSRSDLWPAEARHIAEVTEAAVLASVKPSREDVRLALYNAWNEKDPGDSVPYIGDLGRGILADAILDLWGGQRS